MKWILFLLRLPFNLLALIVLAVLRLRVKWNERQMRAQGIDPEQFYEEEGLYDEFPEFRPKKKKDTQ